MPTSPLPFDLDLFDLLVCPASRAPLKWVDGRLISTDRATRRAYRVDGDIPVMLNDESSEVPQAEWERLMAADGPVGQGAAAVRARHGRS
ncbi:MAG: Trm112 family protein [Planctomycetota bacterium]